MFNITIEREIDTPLLRYGVESLFCSVGVIPNKSINVVIANSFCEKQYTEVNTAYIVFSNEVKTLTEKQGVFYIPVNIINLFSNLLTLSHEQGSKDAYLYTHYGSLPDNLKELLSEPILDDIADNIKKKLEIFFDNNHIGYENSRPWDIFTIILSHDVDHLFGKSLVRYLYWILDLKHFIKNIKRILWWIKQEKDEYYSIDNFLKEESSLGFKSSFYFLVQNTSITLDEGRRYNINSEKIQRLIKLIQVSGFEVGLHPSRRAYDDFFILETEWLKLKKFFFNIKGIRRHYLRGTYPEIWQQSCMLEAEYDSTVGWNDKPGFRAGTARPYQVYEGENLKKINLVELPMIIMDSHFDYTTSEAHYIADFMKFIDTHQQTGVITVNWHTNRLINEIFHKKWFDVYKELLLIWSRKKWRVTSSENYITEYKKYRDKIISNINIKHN